ncbi:type II toxin-antitoxin system RelB/DinJ family antitoxin [Dialister sp.]|uniref:type II toxin-antitoxin system RelB/DinJ family antitoxin n=1 Tax=Dialister sp. TaxID=1955814 RepID=UPI002E817421|nr:type II toxin-antitoxin system RelB/DinJ family antitoxin [Dialister sp.]MEE3453615.1 type II toxin-antitoxin system RelB/DinJ family antitoxin [Dialister sp.]
MAIKTENFNMRMEKQKKSDLETLYGSLGMSLSEAVNIFFSQSLLVGGLPFEVRLPQYNAETLAAMQEAKDIAAGAIPSRTYSSADELFKELDNE